jgi:YVTN family beta-propeller protein
MGDAKLGAVIAGYRIESLIGRGGMSVVYLAEHDRLHRKAALKLLAPELSENESFRTRFIRESELAAGLDHPNVIPVYDAGEAEGVLYIAMRYVKGSDLKAYLRSNGALDPTSALQVVEQVASALDAAHAAGLVHRDVKPANVLIAEGRGGPLGHLYLGDFGLTKKALSASGITRTGQFVGTLDYVAPEQIKNEPVDGRADVYSLGCMLYECLSGRPPFERDAEVATMFAHITDPPPRPTDVRPELPEAIDGVIARAMAKDPAERYPTAGALATAARGALGVGGGDHAVGKTEAPPPAPPPPAPARRRMFVPAGAGVLLLAAIVLAVVLLTRGGGGAAAPPATGTHASSTAFTGGGPLVTFRTGVARIDPSTGKLSGSFRLDLLTVPGGVKQRPIVAGEGAVWMFAGGSDTSLLKVSPDDGSLLDKIQLSSTGTYATPLAEGESSIWVARSGPFRQQVFRVDPATDKVIATIPIGAQVATPSFVTGIAVGAGAVWVTQANGTLSRVDLGTKKVTEHGLGIRADGVVVAGGDVWVTDSLSGAVYRFDPAKDRVVATIPLPGAADGLAGDDQGIWVLDRASGTVVLIDPDTNEVGSPIRVGTVPTGIAVGAGAAWVVNSGDGTVTRIDDTTQVRSTIAVTKPPSGGDVFGLTQIAVGPGGVWVTVG